MFLWDSESPGVQPAKATGLLLLGSAEVLLLSLAPSAHINISIPLHSNFLTDVLH